ncbi:MAG: hypothetical protein H7Z19_09720, partial [Chitinophagaceae bacterium]|nr:hypothetical protein [Rubrivivax sp.]
MATEASPVALARQGVRRSLKRFSRRPPHDLGLLAADAGALEPPIRSVLFGLARFEQHGRSLAQTHEVVAGPAFTAGGFTQGLFFPRLSDNIRVLRRACALLDRQARDGQHLGPAAHWLLDNAALIAEQSSAIREGL